jgi:hypothetical protein
MSQYDTTELIHTCHLHWFVFLKSNCNYIQFSLLISHSCMCVNSHGNILHCYMHNLFSCLLNINILLLELQFVDNFIDKLIIWTITEINCMNLTKIVFSLHLISSPSLSWNIWTKRRVWTQNHEIASVSLYLSVFIPSYSISRISYIVF